MTTPFLYDTPLLPAGFKFPQSYLDLAFSGDAPDMAPWEFLYRDMPRSLSYYGAMLQQYPDKPLVPFAIANDQSGLFNDGYVVLACFDGDDRSGNPKIYYHDYASSARISWAERHCIASFDEWLRIEAEESDRYKAMRDEE